MAFPADFILLAPINPCPCRQASIRTPATDQFYHQCATVCQAVSFGPR
jgi:hypothetical protein